MPSRPFDEPEWLTRKRSIDPRLDAAGWTFVPRDAVTPLGPCRTEEQPTKSGPADYALWLDGRIVGIVEAKRPTTDPRNVLSQATRYARGLPRGDFDFGGLRAPFLYATNGREIWFRDVRHPKNEVQQLTRFHTTDALREMLDRDLEQATQRLAQAPHDHPWLRPYQRDASIGIESAIAEHKRRILLAMATGTGKTFTIVYQIHRLLKAGVARRVLFLVDRRALAAQALRELASFTTERGLKFDQDFEVYSSRLRKEDLDDENETKFDPKQLDEKRLTAPRSNDSFVYVCTIQRIAMALFGREAGGAFGDDAADEDDTRLEIPIHAFDLVIADECHRGYTSSALSIWRDTLNHFDAIQIGLTATPAPHTLAHFKHMAFRYEYEDAVLDGHLVPYVEEPIRSNIRINGVFLRDGEQVEVIDPENGTRRMDNLEDERQFDTTEIEAKITVPDSNRKILEEIKKFALRHEARFGRFPKTLIFAVNDLPTISHAQQVVDIAREVFDRGHDFVEKITGSKDVDRPLQRIREFRNRPTPAIAVTVDLLSTGVDIPDLEFIVFLRPIRSRILFVQMMGRGTRKGRKHKDKSHFTVFDCFDGTLLGHFKNTTDMTSEVPDQPSRSLREVIEDIWNNKDRAYNVRCLVKRLHRVDKEMSGEARQLFAAYVPDGDLGRFARELTATLEARFGETMKLLRDKSFQDLLLNFPRPRRVFLNAYASVDTVTSMFDVREGTIGDYTALNYLGAFDAFVRENAERIDAIRILLERPKEWSPSALAELRQKLAATNLRFTEENLRKEQESRGVKAVADILSLVRHALDPKQPLLTAEERVDRAIAKVSAGQTFTAEQQAWLDRIRAHLVTNLSIDEEDFAVVPILAREGGWPTARKVFGDRLVLLIHALNEAIAA